MQQPAFECDWFESEKLTWRPDREITISQWSEEKRVLTGRSAEKGPFRLRRVPYLAAIMDKCLDDHVQTIVFMKPAQIAGTTAMENICGFFATEFGVPIIFYLADEKTANFICTERLKRMFEDSAKLAEFYDKRNFKKTEIKLPNGGHIVVSWASSVAELGTKEAMIVILDEVDKPGYYIASREASPISLAGERIATYDTGKIFMLSTPTNETGNIAKEMDSCDVIFDWQVPCPHCGVFQPLRWSLKYCWGFEGGKYRDESGDMKPLGQVKWEGGRNATEENIDHAGFECGSCHKIWNTTEKNNAVEKGKMVARLAGDRKIRKVGFHVNRLYSLLGNSGDISKMVRDYIDSLSDPKKLQGFVNSTLAEPWKIVVMRSSEAEILKARVDLAPQTVPGEAIALTCGIDPQKFGFWFTVWAWARNYDSWLIHYDFLPTWDDVENLLFETSYPQAGSERRFRIWRAGIDTGGGKFNDRDPSMTEQAYYFIRQNGVGRGGQVWATKGSSRPLAGKVHKGKLLDQTPSGVSLQGGIQLVLLDADQLKDMIYYRLGNAIGREQMGAYLHKEVKEDFARHILAEEKQLNEKGQQVWVQVKPDNHYLDATCIAHACADPEWIGGGVNILSAALDIEKKKREAIVRAKHRRDVEIIRKSYETPNYLDKLR